MKKINRTIIIILSITMLICGLVNSTDIKAQNNDISLSKSKIYLTVTKDGNRTKRGFAMINLKYGDLVSPASITYKSSDVKVASVNARGKVRGRNSGSAIITVRIDYSKNQKNYKATLKQKVVVAEKTVSDSNKDFYIQTFNRDSKLFSRIKGKSYKYNCSVPVEDLRYLHVLHKDFNGETKVGEIICNKYIADDLIEIFEELYNQNYPIEKICLVDEYDADDESSMEDNNSSCFNFRYIANTTKVSKHGYGMAIDINTLYNPYVKTVSGKTVIEPVTAGKYVDRSKKFKYKIDHNDLAYKLFTQHGFEWGGDWTSAKDYQHFEIPTSVINGLYN